MYRPNLQRVNVEVGLFAARRRVAQLQPFSPSWDAAMGDVEDLERQLWGITEQQQDEPARVTGTGELARP